MKATVTGRKSSQGWFFGGCDGRRLREVKGGLSSGKVV